MTAPKDWNCCLIQEEDLEVRLVIADWLAQLQSAYESKTPITLKTQWDYDAAGPEAFATQSMEKLISINMPLAHRHVRPKIHFERGVTYWSQDFIWIDDNKHLRDILN